MQIIIEGEEIYVHDVKDLGYLPVIDTDDGEFYIAKSSEQAGLRAREYWSDMVRNDPDEFAAIVGTETLVHWALGIGASNAISLEDWLDQIEMVPEEQWATEDGLELSIDSMCEDLEWELSKMGWNGDFPDAVAYRI